MQNLATALLIVSLIAIQGFSFIWFCQFVTNVYMEAVQEIQK